MTPTEVATAARQKYNSVSDTFYSDAELLGLIFEKSTEMAMECLVIEDTSTAVTVASTSEYAWPTTALALKRVTVDSRKVFKIDDRDADKLNYYNAVTTITGKPEHYWIFDRTLTFLPTPDAVYTIKYWFYAMPAAVTSVSTLSIPSQFHGDLVNGVVEEMCLKDENYEAAAVYGAKWIMGKKRATAWQAKQKRGDSFAVVKSEESLPNSILGSG